MADKKKFQMPLQSKYNKLRYRLSTSPPVSSNEEQNMTKEKEGTSPATVGTRNASPKNPDEQMEKVGQEDLNAIIIAARSEQQNNENDLINIEKTSAQVSRPSSILSPMFDILKKSRSPKPDNFTGAIEELWNKFRTQDDNLRAINNTLDQQYVEKEALQKKVDELEENSSMTKEFIAKLQNERESNNQRLQESEASKAVASPSRNEIWRKEIANLRLKVLELEKKLKKAYRQLEESKATKVASSSSHDAAGREEISNLRSKSEVLERKLGEAQEQLKEKSLQAEKIASEHEEEVAKLQEERDNLAIDNTSLEATLASEKKDMMDQIKRLKLELIESKGNFRSWLRLRPPQNDLPRQAITIRGDQQVEVMDRNKNEKSFDFDRVFAPEADNTTVFHDLSEILESTLQGYDITVLAYGQTGSGKTYTMSAMLNMALEQIFRELEKSYGTEFSVKGRCIEIYNDKVYDLFKKAQPLKASGLCTSMWPTSNQYLPAQTDSLSNFQSFQEMVEKVEKNRRSGQTEKNYSSSRSHMFLSFQITASKEEASGAVTTTSSSITFIDLAGSESMKEVEDRTEETQAINSDLSAIRTVLTSMGNKEKHIPFKNRQLTRLLDDGFNKGKVLFIQTANIAELEQSVHTMEIGGLVSKVTQKKPAKNVVTKFATTEVIEEVPQSKPLTGSSTRGRGTERGGRGTTSRPSTDSRGTSRGRTGK
ncbi:hypothetical protein HYFRA_00009597 [Hymenoscyphus fraxineus]|uniref:Kinesin-like protein n=1 Tax=Hymenoscyphus fraxineus TaxID=746836 RepID=A0A9N9PUH9_9HELO|nr:hypothetical protein HYFRA_00009597 [Hymenoscyphus fraxineus]